MLKITKVDAARCRELVKVLSRAKLELDGAEEILAMGQVLSWVSDLQRRIEGDVAEQHQAEQERIKSALELFEAHKPTSAPQMPLAAPQASGVTVTPITSKKAQPKRK